MEFHKKAVNTALNSDDCSRRDQNKIEEETEILFDETAEHQLRSIKNILTEIRTCTRRLESAQGLALSFVLLVYFHLTDSVLARDPEDSRMVKDFKKIFKEYLNSKIGEQEIKGAMATCMVDPRFLRPQNDIPSVDPEETKRLLHWVNDNRNSRHILKTFVQAFWSRQPRIPYNISIEDLYSSNDDPVAVEGLCIAPLDFHTLFEQEWREYLKLAQFTTSDPLRFWKDNAKTLRLLSGAAKLLIPFPASSAGPERVFSVAGWTQNDRRQRMHAQTLKNLLTLRHCWLGWLDFTKFLPDSPTKEGNVDVAEEEDESNVDKGADGVEVEEEIEVL